MQTKTEELEMYLERVKRAVDSPLVDRLMSVLETYRTRQDCNEDKRHVLDAILAIGPKDSRRIVEEPYVMQAIELRMRTPETRSYTPSFTDAQYRWGNDKAAEAVKILAYAFSTRSILDEERNSFLETLVEYNDGECPRHRQGIQLENDNGYWVNYFTNTILDEEARDPEESEHKWKWILGQKGQGGTLDLEEAYSPYLEPYYVGVIEHPLAFEQHEKEMSTFFHRLFFLHNLEKEAVEVPQDSREQARCLNTMIHLWSNAIQQVLPSESRGTRHYREKRTKMFGYLGLEETPFPDRFHRMK